MIFAISDIHGCVVELRMLINELPLTTDTTIVFGGDFIDRGPDSKGVVDTVLELSERYNVINLRGNHESMLLDFLEDPESREAGMFIYNGGSATLESYAEDGGPEWFIPQKHLDFYRGLRLSYETEHDFFVHAGVPDIPLAELDEERHAQAMLWSRRPFLDSTYQWEKMVIHGHTPVKAVDVRENRINIDTGCIYRRRLSALALPGQQVISVPRQQTAERVVLRDPHGSRAAFRFPGEIPVRAFKDGVEYEYLTLDYSELGMYMRPKNPDTSGDFAVGDAVSGVIGPDDVSAVNFRGHIVRKHKEDRGIHYAVQITETDA